VVHDGVVHIGELFNAEASCETWCGLFFDLSLRAPPPAWPMAEVTADPISCLQCLAEEA
jgi:hypothetical protein